MFEYDARNDGHRDRRQEGSAFLIVVLLTLVVAAIGTPMLVMSNTAHQISANERDAERALFAAKAGANYAFYLFDQGTLVPTVAGTAFDSYASAISTPLAGESFSGTVTDMSAAAGRGQLYKITSNGTYNKSTRQIEIIYEINPESAKFGYLAFSKATLHNHSGLSGPSFKIESTIFSNGPVEVPDKLTIAGSIVSLDAVTIDTASTINGNIFANSVSNKGAINGNVKTVAAVSALPASATIFDRVDASGNKYAWFGGASTAGSYSGTGTVSGTKSSYTVANGDVFSYSIFRRDGSLTANPDVNVAEYIDPPQLEYGAMKAEAEKNDPTYFTTAAAAMTYFRTKMVDETIAGKNVRTVKVGTPTNPEFIYVVGNIDINLTGSPLTGVPSGGNTGNSIAADGFELQGGMYSTGTVSFDGLPFDAAKHPSPPDWYQFKINALPYCMPAIIAYPQPGTGTIASWTPASTPAMGSGGDIDMSSGTGFFFFSGLTLSGAKTHLHHVNNATELIRFIGAELADEIHNCDYMWFTYDPNVRCTRFLANGNGTSAVVSYREVR